MRSRKFGKRHTNSAPGSIGIYVKCGTPSSLLGKYKPCQCKDVDFFK